MASDLRPDGYDDLSGAIRHAFAGYGAPVRDFETSPGRLPLLQRRLLQRPQMMALSTAVAMAAVVLVAVVVVQLLAPPTSVYASWTAVPSSPDEALIARVTQQCREGMTKPPADADVDGVPSEEHRLWLRKLADAAALPLVAVDRRGDVALALFSDGQAYASCIVSRGGDGGSTVVSVGSIDAPLSGVVRVLSGVAHEGQPPLRLLIGDIDASVAAVTIERADGTQVSATVNGGYFLAWWPTPSGVRSITAHDAAGNAVRTLDGDIFETAPGAGQVVP